MLITARPEPSFVVEDVVGAEDRGVSDVIEDVDVEYDASNEPLLGGAGLSFVNPCDLPIFGRATPRLALTSRRVQLEETARLALVTRIVDEARVLGVNEDVVGPNVEKEVTRIVDEARVLLSLIHI